MEKSKFKEKKFANNRIDYVINLINPKNSDKILNIGVSNIPEIEIKIEKKIKECWTLDLDKEKIKKAEKYTEKTKYLYGDIYDKSLLKNKKFDKAVMLEVLEHLKEDLLALKRVNSLLKVGGDLIISVPNDNLLHLINPVKYTQHERHYSNKMIKKVLHDAGFKIKDFNIVENFSLLVNLYIHLFFKYILRKQRNFLTFKKSSGKTYKQYNKNGLDIIIKAEKISEC